MMNMEDIAKLCGVSRQTVHAAIYGKPGVSAHTRQRILEVVKQYNYQPNRLATTLQRRATNLIGLTILNIRNPFFAELIQGVNAVLREENLHLLFFETPDKEEEEEAVATLTAYRVAGIILSPVQDETRVEHVRALMRQGTPLVTVGPMRGVETHYVEVENQVAAALATEHLIRRGHRRLCYLEGPPKIVSAHERALGFVSTLLAHRLPLGEGTVVPAGETTSSGREAAMRVLSRPAHERPTGIVCFNDVVAIGVYEAAEDLGLAIPDDVSVVGCDDIELARLLGPPLTTVALPIAAMGRAAAEMLVAQIEARRTRSGGVVGRPQLLVGGEEGTGFLIKRFQPTLVPRGSVRDISADL